MTTRFVSALLQSSGLCSRQPPYQRVPKAAASGTEGAQRRGSFGGAYQPQLALPELRSLSFRAGGGNDYALHSPIDLRHLPRLQHVELGLGQCAPSLELLLPQTAEVLQIADHTDFPVATPRRYLDASSNRFLPLLRRLDLDIMDYNGYGNCGQQFNLKQSVSRRSAEATFGLHRSWRQPAWSSNILYKQLMSLWEMAAVRGVITNGGVLRATNIQHGCNNQLGIIAAAKTRWLATGTMMRNQQADRAETEPALHAAEREGKCIAARYS